MSAGFRALLELLGLWPSKSPAAPPVAVEPGCIDISLNAAQITVAITAPMIAVSVRQAQIAIDIQPCCC